MYSDCTINNIMDVLTSSLPLKCLICNRFAVPTVEDHFQTIHNIFHKLPLLEKMTVEGYINIDIEKLEGVNNLEIHTPSVKKKSALSCYGACCNNPRYLVDKNTGVIIEEDNLAPLYEWCDKRPAQQEDIPKVLSDFEQNFHSLPRDPFIIKRAPKQKYLEIEYKCPHCNHIFLVGASAQSISNHYASNHIEILLDGHKISDPQSTSEKPVPKKKCKACNIHCPIEEPILEDDPIQEQSPKSTFTLEMECSFSNEDDNVDTPMTRESSNKGIGCETIYKPVRSFKCKVCNYSTDLKHNLTRHGKTHNKDTHNIVCNQCGNTFDNITKFKEHIAITHKSYNCNNCQKKLKSIKLLKVHKQKYHE